jgi:glycosyltransferase involved in cell wall biosynthesis
MSLVGAMKSLWQRGFQGWLVLTGSSTSAFDEYLRQQPNLPFLLNLGQVSDAEKRDLLDAADLLVHPSRVESLGIVYLEAWANAKPVVAADTAVSRDIINAGEDGLLVPFGDTEAIAEAIKYLCEDPLQRQRLGIAGKKKVLAKYSWDKVMPGIIRVFQEHCGDRAEYNSRDSKSRVTEI